MTALLAFYEGPGRIEDRVIRFVTRSKFSHVEYIHDLNCTNEWGRVECWSSSGRDGGVRRTYIDVKNDNWTLVPIHWIDDDRRNFFKSRAGEKYDWLGLLLSQFFAFRRHAQRRWFCSEICATVIGLPTPQSLAPGDLYNSVKAANQLYLKARQKTAQH